MEEGQASLEREIPWPGPKPYEEFQWERFAGRGDEIEDLLGRVRVAGITVLLGASGSGKTSLIRAGLVPQLRTSRYTGRRRYMTREEARSTWPTLLLREGGAKRESTVEANWLQQLKSAIGAMESWGRQFGQLGAVEDAEFLRSCVEKHSDVASKQDRFVALIGELASQQAQRAASGLPEGAAYGESGLILVFDQFEEQLRSGPRAHRDAFRLIHDLVVSGAPVKLLLSMRKEFRADLKDLEKLIGELGRNSVYLERLESPKVVEVIEQVSKSGEISIDKTVAERIVGWLTPGPTAADDGSETARDTPPDEEMASDAPPEATPDLLKLQAVLVELCRWALRRQEHSVTAELFQHFVFELGDRSAEDSLRPSDVARGGKGAQFAGKLGMESGERESEEQLGEKVVRSTLERWIEDAISRKESASERNAAAGEVSSASNPRESPSYADLSMLTDKELRLQVRRIVVRMAPLLSSADYKVQQEENALFRQVLGEEIKRLPFKDQMGMNQFEIIEREGELRLNWPDLGRLEEPTNDEESWRILSGPARKWTAEQAGDRLLACFKATLERMAAGNILRMTPVSFGAEEKKYWELVHDQFGPNLVRWALDQKGTWDDCKSSLVVCRGIQPLAVLEREISPERGEEDYVLEGMSWQGCGIAQARTKPLTFRRVVFRNCYLVGTIFDGITFLGCSFEDSMLTGALFRNCNFLRDDKMRPTRFVRCDSNVAIVGGAIDGLEFRRCQLNQPAIKGTRMDGDLVYADGSRVIQGLFEKITLPEKGQARIRVDSDSVAAYCLFGSECDALWAGEREAPGAPNGTLRDEFRTGLEAGSRSRE